MRLTAATTKKLDPVTDCDKLANWSVIEEGEVFEFERGRSDTYKFYKSVELYSGNKKDRNYYRNRLVGYLPASLAEPFIESCKEISK